MKEAILYKKEGLNARCLACAQHCIISEGKTGVCGVRKNVGGKLYLLVYGKIASIGIDPIEKKPLYYFLPGTKTYSISTVGCNFKCVFCQNYNISQASKGLDGVIFGQDMKPEKVVEEALKTGCQSISYTYNEPSIYIEYVKDVAVIAKKRGLKNILVTNGYLGKESFDFIKDYIDAMNIDLKSYSDEFYKIKCGARLEPVLDTIKRAWNYGIWIELTTLIIPGENDSPKEMGEIAKFIASIDKGIPWHISRFFPMYRMVNNPITPKKTLEQAYDIGKKYLKHVHIGNV